MLCYRCGGHVKDGSEKCGSCGQAFALGLVPGPIAGFGTGSRRHRVAIEGTPYKPGDALARRYQVKDHVGAGPVGWVYRVADTEADVDVAMKVISPRFVQMPEERRAFLAEMQRAKALSHPNLVRVYDYGEDQERPFVATQFLEGLTLRRIMDLRRQKGQGFSLKEVEPIVAQVAAALEAAAEVFAHGDLKPDNVIVLPDLLKLTDFGLAVSLPRAPFMAAQKAGGVHRYLAPEFLLGDRLDARTDVYSLGVMVAELLAGAQYEPTLDLCARNPALPKGVQDIFRRAVAHKPHERFSTPVDLADELCELLEKGDARAHASPSANTRPNATRPTAPSSPSGQTSLPMAAQSSLPPPMPLAAPPAPPVVEAQPDEQDEVVIEEVHTDPRIRIARALAQHDEQIRAEAKKSQHAGPATSAAVQIPGTLQTSLLPEPDEAREPAVAARQKDDDAAAVAARVGATPELLTAETAVKAAPTAPPGYVAPSAQPAPAAPAPVAAAPAATPAAPAAAEAPAEEKLAAGAPAAAVVADSDLPTQTMEKVPSGKRGQRGRGKQHGNKREERIAARRAAAAAAQPAPAKDEWALITLPATPGAAPVEVKPVEVKPVVIEPVAIAVAAPTLAPIRAGRAAAVKAAPSFGNLVEKKQRLTPQVLAAGGLLVLIALVAAVGILRWARAESPKDEAAQAAPAEPVAPAAIQHDKAAPPAPAKAAEPAPEKKNDAAPAKAEEKPAKAHAEEARPARTSAQERLRKNAAAEQRRQDLWEKLRARREARQARKGEKAAGEQADAAAEARRREQEKAIARASAHRNDKDAPAATAAVAGAHQEAAPLAVAAVAVKPAGGIPGADDGDLLAAKAQQANYQEPRKLAVVVPASASAPAASAGSCPSGTSLVPGGRALIGSDSHDDLRNFGDRNLTAVDVKAVCVDQFEYPNHPGKLPKVGAAFTEAEALCQAAGKRLCSEEEWEKACKGPEGLRFPYGAQFDPEACNTQDKVDLPRQVGPSAAFSRCKSAYGVYDLSGNVAEWTTGSFEGGIERTVKGGSAARPGFDDRCASRRKARPGLHDVKIGFRCCVEPK